MRTLRDVLWFRKWLHIVLIVFITDLVPLWCQSSHQTIENLFNRACRAAVIARTTVLVP